MFDIIEKRRDFIVEEADVTTVLTGMNDQCKHKYLRNITVANCGWADEPTKWFIAFNATDTMYGKIVKRLSELGTLKLKTRPGGQVDVTFVKEA